MIIDRAKKLLTILRERSDAIGVAFSAGKDSWATLDLCCGLFKRVEAYYLYRIEGLEVIERLLERARKRYGVQIHQYPHFDLTRCFKNAILQPHWHELRRVPRVSFTDVERTFREEVNVDFIAYGWRRNDSMSRAMIMHQTHGIDWQARRIYPIYAWSRANVLSYLSARSLPTPPTFGRKDQGGVDFHPEAMRYIKERFPKDYAKIQALFPYVETSIIAADLRRNSKAESAATAS